MARARKVKAEEAVAASMALFWKYGFDSLGTRQLEEETGLTRFTLQTSYGGKRALFLTALDAYLEQLENGFLPSPDCDLRDLAAWFRSRVKCDPDQPMGNYGCLMVNSMTEFAGRDEDISIRVECFYAMLRARFSTLLDGAMRRGVLSAKFDVAAQTEVLVAVSIGLNVTIRAAQDATSGLAVAEGAARMIEDWLTIPTP